MIRIGIQVTVPDGGVHTVRAKLICAVMDLPAKAAILIVINTMGNMVVQLVKILVSMFSYSYVRLVIDHCLRTPGI